MPHINYHIGKAFFLSFHVGGFCPFQLVIGDTFAGWGFVVWLLWFHCGVTGIKSQNEATVLLSLTFEVGEVMKDE